VQAKLSAPGRLVRGGWGAACRIRRGIRRSEVVLSSYWYLGNGFVCGGTDAVAGVDSNCDVIIRRLVLYEIIHAARAQHRSKVDPLTVRALGKLLGVALLLASIQAVADSSGARLAGRSACIPGKKYFVVPGFWCRRLKRSQGRAWARR